MPHVYGLPISHQEPGVESGNLDSIVRRLVPDSYTNDKKALEGFRHIARAALENGLGVSGALAAVAIDRQESNGGVSPSGDSGNSAGMFHLYRGGQAANFARARNMTVDQALTYLKAYPEAAADWALSPGGYLHGLLQNPQGDRTPQQLVEAAVRGGHNPLTPTTTAYTRHLSGLNTLPSDVSLPTSLVQQPPETTTGGQPAQRYWQPQIPDSAFQDPNPSVRYNAVAKIYSDLAEANANEEFHQNRTVNLNTAKAMADSIMAFQDRADKIGHQNALLEVQDRAQDLHRELGYAGIGVQLAGHANQLAIANLHEQGQNQRLGTQLAANREDREAQIRFQTQVALGLVVDPDTGARVQTLAARQFEAAEARAERAETRAEAGQLFEFNKARGRVVNPYTGEEENTVEMLNFLAQRAEREARQEIDVANITGDFRGARTLQGKRFDAEIENYRNQLKGDFSKTLAGYGKELAGAATQQAQLSQQAASRLPAQGSLYTPATRPEFVQQTYLPNIPDFIRYGYELAIGQHPGRPTDFVLPPPPAVGAPPGFTPYEGPPPPNYVFP